LSLIQTENGDPSQDVGIATILFLVDGKLVVLQPSTKEGGELKYDMRIVAQNVEYYVLMRDQQHFLFESASAVNSLREQVHRPIDEESATPISAYHQNDLRDSLWYFDGSSMQAWTDVQDLLASAPPELGRELPPTVTVPVDFYPLSVLLGKGIFFGIEPDVTHNRREVGFSMTKFVTRVCFNLCIKLF
jgi:RAB6A-GEF complex partner protein 1